MFTDRSFILDGKEYKYWHKGGWANTERLVEVPLALDFIQEVGDVIEVGNVSRPHKSSLSHFVIDLTEIREGWENYENADVLTYVPQKSYDGVLSVSTVEHTKDVVTAIRRILSWAPRALITLPLGYKTPGGRTTDEAVFEHAYDAEISILRREYDEFSWFQVSIADAIATGFNGFRYGHSGFAKGATAIAIFQK